MRVQRGEVHFAAEEVGMSHGFRRNRRFVVLGLTLGALFGLPSIVAAQTASRARAVQVTVPGATVLGITLPGTTTVLADTGALSRGATDALQASSVAASVPPLLSGDSLHATVIGLPDQATSEASLGGLGLSRSEEHTSELQSQSNLVCRLLLEKKKKKNKTCMRDMISYIRDSMHE